MRRVRYTGRRYAANHQHRARQVNTTTKVDASRADTIHTKTKQTTTLPNVNPNRIQTALNQMRARMGTSAMYLLLQMTIASAMSRSTLVLGLLGPFREYPASVLRNRTVAAATSRLMAKKVQSATLRVAFANMKDWRQQKLPWIWKQLKNASAPQIKSGRPKSQWTSLG